MLDAATFGRFRELIYSQSGIALHDNKEALVAARVAKRMRTLGLASYDAYLDLVVADPSGEELVHLLDAISTNVTSFFREAAHFELLSQQIGRWLEDGVGKLRLWSAACSSGEEPYTMAMVLNETIGQRWVDWKILATDLSTKVLQRAQQGLYTADRLTGIPPDLRQRYFTPVLADGQRRWQVIPALRERVLFRRLNLVSPPFPMKGELDVVFCRNVMIYFDLATRRRLVEELERLLKPGGLFFVGHAESLTGVTTRFKSLRPSAYAKP